ncbi:MAG: DUF362 domain-containing protein, partial [Nitrospira sp.]|nr:DUF362 domain-containing protein [Nitrospira sp.]
MAECRSMIPGFLFVHEAGARYPSPPFDPPEAYPELGDKVRALDPSNTVYRMVRGLLLEAGLDAGHAGTPEWNPLRGLIGDGQSVMIKPNLVIHETGANAGQQVLTTHASVVRPFLDYFHRLRASDGVGVKIVIGDVPLQSADWERITVETGFKALAAYGRDVLGLDLSLLDLRKEIAVATEGGFIRKRIQNAGDPLGYTSVRMDTSFLDEIIQYANRFSIGDYDDSSTSGRHQHGRDHAYLIAKSVLASSLFINVPKIKTHQKAGITVAMKNLIGINGDKSWIPHHRLGAPSAGGDEYSQNHALLKLLNAKARKLLQERSEVLWNAARFVNRKIVKRALRRPTVEQGPQAAAAADTRSFEWAMDGAWFGNDTLWRSILDLNRILLLGAPDGTMKLSRQRHYLCLAEGIVAGEGDGPLAPTAKAAGLLTFAADPVVHDVGCARLMGFDWRALKVLERAPRGPEAFAFDGDPAALSLR